MKSWRTLGWIAVAAACVLYAFLAHRAASTASPGPFDAAVLVSPLLTLAVVLAWRSRHRLGWLTLLFLGCAGLVMAARRGAPAAQWVLLLEHGGINASLAIAFGRTLLPGRSRARSERKQGHGPNFKAGTLPRRQIRPSSTA